MSLQKPKNVLVIGLGHQSIDDHIPAIVDSEQLHLFAVCDIDSSITKEIAEEYGVLGTTHLSTFLSSYSHEIDIGLIAVPHQSYLPIIRLLAKHKINIIKEKPFATSWSEAKEIEDLVSASGIGLKMTLQRRYNPVFTSYAQLIRRLGKLHSIEARYVMNIKNLDEGWRASSLFSGGGALIDLGYHYIDLIIWYFGLPDNVMCHVSSGNREGQVYDVEDTAFVQFSYNDNQGAHDLIAGNLVVSRVYPSKDEKMITFGTKGYASVQRGLVKRVLSNGQEESLERKGTWPSALVDQLEHCSEQFNDEGNLGVIDPIFMNHVAFIEAAYHSAKIGSPIDPHMYFNQV